MVQIAFHIIPALSSPHITPILSSRGTQNSRDFLDRAGEGHEHGEVFSNLIEQYLLLPLVVEVSNFRCPLITLFKALYFA